MTPTEIRETAKTFANEIGPDATILISIHIRATKLLFAMICPDGVGRDSALCVSADEWPELFTTLRAKWAERADEYRRKTIRKLALEIIRITAEQGECTDAALRGVSFSATDVARYGAEAVADANAIASNGPFAIVAAAKENAA